MGKLENSLLRALQAFVHVTITLNRKKGGNITKMLLLCLPDS